MQRAAAKPVLWMLILVLVGASLAGCAAGPADEPGPTDDAPSAPPVAAATPEPSAEELFRIYQPFVTDYNTRRANHQDHLDARDALERHFAALGLDVVRQKFEDGIPQENIVGIQWGEIRNEWVIVGAHYDTTTNGNTHDEVSQGAYDDGSGTMMLVELARAFKDVPTMYTIAFAAFDGEERGLQGSGALYRAINEDDFPGHTGINFRAMLDIDMFGLNWPICAPMYVDENNDAVQAAVEAAAKEIGIPDEMIKFQGITLGQSDYAHWYGTETPTVFFIADFEELAAPGIGGRTPAGCLPPAAGAYPFWHTMDTWETMMAMAGGEDPMKAGFQTGLDLTAATLLFLAQDNKV